MSKIQVNEIVNHFDTGAPDCPKGLTVTGFSTFTGSASFSGDVSIGGTLTYEDVTNIDSVGIITAQSGLDVSNGGLDVTGIATFQTAVDSIGIITARSGVHYGTVGSGVTISAVGAGTSLGFLVNGSERARIDADGRLLVGTSTARTNLRSGVYGSVGQIETAGTNAFAFIQNTTEIQPCRVVLAKQKSGSTGGNTSVSSGDNIGSIEFLGNDGTNFIRAALIAGAVDGTTGANDMPGRLVFSTTADGASGPTERMRIDSSGRLLVGTNTSQVDTAYLQSYVPSGGNQILVQSDDLGTTTCIFRAKATRSGGTTNTAELGVYRHGAITDPCSYIRLQAEDTAALFYWTDNSNILRTSTNSAHIGTTSGNVVGNQTSDERIKNIIGPVEYGLNILKQIEPVRYSLKSEPEKERLGFIAQQVQPLVPQSVYDTNEHIEGEPEDAPTKLAMEYVALIPVLVNAIKELTTHIETLETRLTALEGN